MISMVKQSFQLLTDWIFLLATVTLLGLLFMLYWLGLALWVYKDSGSKKLNAPLWGLLVLFTNAVGLMVYLIYSQNNQSCYKCGASQSKTNIFCSHCGTKINSSYESCRNVVGKRDCYCGQCGGKLEK